MEKNILVIDDQANALFLERLQETFERVMNNDSHVQYKISLKHYDPTDDIDNGADGVLNQLEKNYLSGRLHLVLCDFNFGNEEKLLAFKIISKIRDLNKTCTLVLYSGNTFSDLMRYEINGLSEYLEEHVKGKGISDSSLFSSGISRFIKEHPKDYGPFEDAVCSNISAFLPRNDEFYNNAADYLKTPLVEMILEDALVENSHLVLASGSPSMDGVELGALAESIRNGTAESSNYISQVLDAGLSALIDADD